jgi:hypothetical protein
MSPAAAIVIMDAPPCQASRFRQASYSRATRVGPGPLRRGGANPLVARPNTLALNSKVQLIPLCR